MKALIKTSVFVLVVAGILAVMAGSATAAPMDKAYLGDHDIDRLAIRDVDDMVLLPVDEGPFPDGGGEDCVGCDDEEFPDDGGDVPGDDGDDADDDQPLDDGGDEGTVDEEETPPIDDGDDSGKTDEEQKPPTTDTTSGKKLPNTGTQLAIIGGIGLLAALTAVATRRALKKRVR